jgi:hypothetical protein
VPANSQSASACSEFAVGKPRWHGRIAIVGRSLFFLLEIKKVNVTQIFVKVLKFNNL